MRRLRGVLASAALSGALCFPVHALPPTTGTLNPPTYFGINGIGYFHRPSDAAEIQRRIELVRELGVRWDRSDFWWSEIERRPGQWDFSIPDAAVQAYRNAGIQMLPILCYGAAWRDTQGPVTPEQLDEWTGYVNRVTRRYKDYNDTWEVWNEPNIIPFWRPQPDADAYARLLLATRKVAAPGSNLVGLVLADLDHEFLERVLQVAGVDCVDRVSYHFYRIGQPEERTLDEVAELKLMLERYGKPNCPIWVTEMGVTSHLSTEGVSEDLQAIYWMRQVLLLIAGGVERVFPFCLVDNVTDPGGPWGSQLGMITLDGRKKPVFFAYKTMVAELQDFELVGPVTLGEHVHAYLFQRREGAPAGPVQYKLVAWTTRDVQDIRIDIDDIPTTQSAPGTLAPLRPIPQHLRHVTTLLGERKPVELDGATQRVMLSPSPVYLLVENRHLLLDAQARVRPAAMIVSPGQRRSLPALHTTIDDLRTSSVELPVFCQAVDDSFVVTDNPPEGWHSITYKLVTTSGTIVKKARLWVQPRADVQVRAFAQRTASDVITSFSITSRGTEAIEYRFTSKPALAGFDLPRGQVGGIPAAAWQGSADGTGPFLDLATVVFPKQRLLELGSNLTLFMETRALGSVHRAPAFRFAVLPLLGAAPIIDGKLSEYDGIPEMYLGEPGQVLAAEWRAKHVEPDDASVRVRCGWMPNGLYIAARITDDHPMINPNPAGPNIYKGDGLEIYLGTEGYQGEHYSNRGGGYYHFALSPGRGGEGAVVSDFTGEVQGARVAVQPTAIGYNLEGFIPSSAIGNYRPAHGDMLAWDVQLNDRDTYTEPAQHKALMWNGDHLNWLRAGKWGMAVVGRGSN